MPRDQTLDPEYTTFVRRVRHLTGIDLAGYKPEQMRRRLTALAARHGAATLPAFAELMARDPAALQAFKNFFTINVSEFLRDPARWEDLARVVLPRLYEEGGRRPLRVWSAGCAHGAEPYSLAMLLEELAPGQPHRILATDIDEAALARAMRGSGYQEAELRHVDAARRARFFTRTPDGTYAVTPALRARVTFQQHDLLTGVPGHGWDLIVCRNVVIYFTETAKRTLYLRLAEALRPGGVLFVGGTEVVTAARELGFVPLLTSFYQKVGLRCAGAA
jgi:chemotaxis protein methyltransferase CheR